MKHFHSTSLAFLILLSPSIYAAPPFAEVCNEAYLEVSDEGMCQCIADGEYLNPWNTAQKSFCRLKTQLSYHVRTLT